MYTNYYFIKNTNNTKLLRDLRLGCVFRALRLDFTDTNWPVKHKINSFVRLTITHLALSPLSKQMTTWATLNIGIYYHCFASEATRCLLGENSGYITSFSPPTPSLYVSSCLCRLLTFWKKATKQKVTREERVFFFSDVFAVVKTSFLTATLCLIWTDSYRGSDIRKIISLKEHISTVWWN